jgi:hypothetical protein
MIVYSGSLDDPCELIQFFRREAAGLRSLRRLRILEDKTVVLDVNGDGIEFPGLTAGHPTLETLLSELGVVYTPRMLQAGTQEIRLSARWTWGHDRVM